MLLKRTLHDLGILEFHSVQCIANSASIEVLQIIAGYCSISACLERVEIC